jgi:hypothetical protein
MIWADFDAPRGLFVADRVEGPFRGPVGALAGGRFLRAAESISRSPSLSVLLGPALRFCIPPLAAPLVLGALFLPEEALLREPRGAIAT